MHSVTDNRKQIKISVWVGMRGTLYETVTWPKGQVKDHKVTPRSSTLDQMCPVYVTLF